MLGISVVIWASLTLSPSWASETCGLENTCCEPRGSHSQPKCDCIKLTKDDGNAGNVTLVIGYGMRKVDVENSHIRVTLFVENSSMIDVCWPGIEQIIFGEQYHFCGKSAF